MMFLIIAEVLLIVVHDTAYLEIKFSNAKS